MRLFFLVLLLVAFTAPALAGAPEVRPIYSPDGVLSFCLGEQTYIDGRKMTLALSPRDQLNLGFTIPAGNFKTGERYDLTLTLDAGEQRHIRAGALDNTTILLQMGVNPAFRKSLMASRALSVGTEAHMLSFDLPAMEPLFKNIKKCLAETASMKNVAAAKTQDPAMPESLHALLGAAGFTDIVPMRMEGVAAEDRPADFIWQTGKVLGGVRQRAAPPDSTLSDLIGLHIQGLKKKCVGVFTSDIEREQAAPHTRLRLAQVQCAPRSANDGKAVTVALLFSLTDAGDLTVFTHEAAGDGKTEALAARDKLAKWLLSSTK